MKTRIVPVSEIINNGFKLTAKDYLGEEKHHKEEKAPDQLFKDVLEEEKARLNIQ